MKKHKLFKIVLFASLIFVCLIVSSACKSNDQVNDTVIQEIATEDSIANRINFDKKYYSLDYDGYSKDVYYTFKDDGTAIYTHVMKSGDKITFHQEINFKWTYAGEGECIMIHNGTKMLVGEQDEALGIGRVMHVSKDAIYWSSSGSNSYFVCEDFTNKIPNYAKII